MKPIACWPPATGSGFTQSPMCRPPARPSRAAVRPPGWSAAASMWARMSAGTRASGWPVRHWPKLHSTLAMASNTLGSMSVASPAWAAIVSRAPGASLSRALGAKGRPGRCGPRTAATTTTRNRVSVNPENVDLRIRLGSGGHPLVGVDDPALDRGEQVHDQEAAVADPPEGDPSGKGEDLAGLGLGEVQHLPELVQLRRRLLIDHLGGGVAEQSPGELHLLRPGGPRRQQVADAVHDGDVLDPQGPAQLEARLQPPGDLEILQHHPGLVDDHDAAVMVVAGQRALQPGRRTDHEDAQRLRMVDGGQVERDQGGVEVDPRRSRSVEHAPELAVAETA